MIIYLKSLKNNSSTRRGLVWEEVKETPKPEITNATYTD